MTINRSKEILSAGMESAFEKMSLDRCLPKKEITDLSFLELYARIIMELRELEDEIYELKVDYPDAKVPLTLLRAIRSEAGDVISFASGIVAKVDAELEAREEKQPTLPGLDE
jgi:hypothetical protein